MGSVINKSHFVINERMRKVQIAFFILVILCNSKVKNRLI